MLTFFIHRNLHATDLYVPIKPKQWPIVYTNQYNINAFGMQKLHPFDAGKWGRVFQMLKGKSFSYFIFSPYINNQLTF